MKSFIKVLGLFAICLVAGLQFSSCSSSDGEDSPLETKYDITGNWSVKVVNPIRPESLDFETALSFVTPFIHFTDNGKVEWHEWIVEEARPSDTKNHGTYSIKDNKLTINAPGNKWMNGTHMIESVNKQSIVMIVETSQYKCQFILEPSYYNL